MRLLVLFALCLTTPAMADTVLAARTIRAQSLIMPQDLVVKQIDVVGAIVDPSKVIGQEARVALYAGRPIRPGDVGPPAVVERNQIISLIYEQSGISITTEGRSLGRAGPGEFVRVMNLSSRLTVSGQVLPDGRVIVSN
ncbi:flagellar basal body P-ring formation chaperone FlgA [Roseovarius aestuarii]|nr:flagellar basal body P-ring formation chaperone FlgA [Roseovarius aestuarii]